MNYCDGICKYLNTRKHKCELTGEKLAYMNGVVESNIQCMNTEDSVRKIRRTKK